MTETTGYKKALPQIREDTRPFWEGCKRHELLIQRCSDCGTFRHPPRPMCHKCNSMNAEWVEVTKGIVYSYLVLRKFGPPYIAPPGFEGDLPMAVVLVELPEAENIRMISNVVGCDVESIKIGMPLEVVFDDVTEEITLPKFKPAV